MLYVANRIVFTATADDKRSATLHGADLLSAAAAIKGAPPPRTPNVQFTGGKLNAETIIPQKLNSGNPNGRAYTTLDSPTRTGADTIEYLAGQGGRFCLVKSWNARDTEAPGKQPIGNDWQARPYTGTQAALHVGQGGNAGLLTGRQSGDGDAGYLCIIDVDQDYSEFVELFPWAEHTPTIRRVGADRAKLIVRVLEPLPESKSFKLKPTDKHPVLEFLSTGRQGVVAGKHPTGVEYELVNTYTGIPIFTPEKISAICEQWIGQSLKEQAQAQEEEQQARRSDAERHDAGDLLGDVITRWPTLAVFEHFGRAAEVRSRGDEKRLKGNGGLFVNGDRWYCFTDEVGGGPLEAWQYCTTGEVKKLRGREFVELLKEMAKEGGVPIPEYQPKAKAGEGGQTTSGEQKPERKARALRQQYIEELTAGGYAFSMCDLDDRIYVNGKPITDTIAAEIRAWVRDLDILHPSLRFGVEAAEDAYRGEAARNVFNPYKQIIDGLRWDGVDHISRLADYIVSTDDTFRLFLLRWIVGAVAKLYSPGTENRVLVLAGGQDMGKSKLREWLALPFNSIDGATVEMEVSPDDVDHQLLRTTTLVWEIDEFGRVTRKSDRESLKAFLTATRTKARQPYGHFPIDKPNIASFIATVNPEGGFLNDPTGSRRFMISEVQAIDWRGYVEDLDPAQLWAQAKALYDAGDRGQLADEEKALANEINAQFKLTNVTGEALDQIVVPDSASAFMVLDALAALGLDTRSAKGQLVANEISAYMTEHGYKRVKGNYYTHEGDRKQGTGWIGARLEYVPAGEMSRKVVSYPAYRVAAKVEK